MKRSKIDGGRGIKKTMKVFEKMIVVIVCVCQTPNKILVLKTLLSLVIGFVKINHVSLHALLSANLYG